MANIKYSRQSLAIVLLLAAVLTTQNLKSIVTPFWKAQQQNPLINAYVCGDQFKPALDQVEKVGFFYESPQPGFEIYDKRITPQIQLQYVLVPTVLDHRPEKLEEYQWVIGYFINEKLAETQANEIGPILGLQPKKVCLNYVLFERQ
jgi:hypothetical protein